MLTRQLINDDSMELVGINDLADINTQAHLFKYDSVHGIFNGPVSVEGNFLKLNGREIPYYAESDISKIPWEKPNIVVECTGKFTRGKQASLHLENGAGRVIISAPSSSDDVKTILVGINHDTLNASDLIISNASCTTNSAGPLIKVIDANCIIENAYITTVHSYTGDQRLHDSPHKDLRRARAAALSIVPTTTGAAKAITRIFPHLDGKIGGCGIRVPVPNGSLTDISCTVKDPANIQKLNSLFRDAADNELNGILEYTEDPIVSTDIIGNPHSCIYDAQLTSIIGNMVKVVGWYDNEAGYAARLYDLIKLVKNL